MGKNGQKKHNESSSVFGLDTTPWIVSAAKQAKKSPEKMGAAARIVVLGEQKEPEQHFGDLGIQYAD